MKTYNKLIGISDNTRKELNSIEDVAQFICKEGLRSDVRIEKEDGSLLLDTFGTFINKITDSEAEDGSAPYGSSAAVTKPSQSSSNSSSASYVGNKNTKKFHYPTCSSVGQMKESNKKYLNCTRDQAIQQGFDPCGRCCP